tara:strand:- start:109 stop:501 length:393 start_codon:yes stop_codon:yes gene_type:complete
MNEAEKIRVDKWLFAVRLFKTRGQAADACRNGKVKLNDAPAKAAKHTRMGDTIIVRQGPMTRTLKVVGLTERRVGAKLVSDFAKDETPEAEQEKLRLAKRDSVDNRNNSKGRPSKRERRLIDQFTNLGQA